MSVAVGDVIQAVASLLLTDGTTALNIFHYRLDGDTAQVEDDVMVAIATLLNNLYTDLQPLISDGCVVNPILFNIVAFNATEGGWRKTRELGYKTPTWAPTNIADVFPNQMAAVISAATAIPKRIGRKFFAGFAENQATGGELIGTALTALAAAAVDYMAWGPMGGSNYLVPVIPDANSAVSNGITAVTANSIMGTQRRRKPGVGS